LSIELSPHALTYQIHENQRTFRVQDESGAVLLRVIFDITTKIVFAVNQLTPSSIGISPLTKIPPKLLLQLQVRSINQILASSLGFGSNLADLRH